MLVACRLAGLSALILDYVGGLAVAQLSALGAVEAAREEGESPCPPKAGGYGL
jgi:hypothetical protein